MLDRLANFTVLLFLLIVGTGFLYAVFEPDGIAGKAIRSTSCILCFLATMIAAVACLAKSGDQP